MLLIVARIFDNWPIIRVSRHLIKYEKGKKIKFRLSSNLRSKMPEKYEILINPGRTIIPGELQYRWRLNVSETGVKSRSIFQACLKHEMTK